MTAFSQRRKAKPLKEIDILWITAGLGCDGESIAMTAATQPIIEDLILSGIPGRDGGGEGSHR